MPKLDQERRQFVGNVAGWTSARYMPRIRGAYGNDPDKIHFDFRELNGWRPMPGWTRC
jgi:hypothetical protein